MNKRKDSTKENSAAKCSVCVKNVGEKDLKVQ